MSEVAASGGGGKEKGGKVRAKKASTKIDMTPMVDLAFLLLTFFMLATTFNKPQTMEITMPEKVEEPIDQPLVNERNVLTLILDADDKVYWYIGITDPQVSVTNYSKDGIRKILAAENAKNPKLIVLIKLSDKARYANMVDMLDEMTISEVKRYALVDITPTDLELIKEPLNSGK